MKWTHPKTPPVASRVEIPGPHAKNDIIPRASVSTFQLVGSRTETNRVGVRSERYLRVSQITVIHAALSRYLFCCSEGQQSTRYIFIPSATVATRSGTDTVPREKTTRWSRREGS